MRRQGLGTEQLSFGHITGEQNEEIDCGPSMSCTLKRWHVVLQASGDAQRSCYRRESAV
jgi:hypothetical protein